MEEKKLTLKEEIAKSFEKKSKEKIKFILSLIISNFFVFILCSVFMVSTPAQKDTSKLAFESEFPSPGHEFIVLDVAQTLIAKNHLIKNQFVTILNENKSILVAKAKMISAIETKNSERNEFKFEISQNDISHLRENLTEKVIVVPLLISQVKENKKKNVINYKRSKYEIPYHF